MNSILMLGVVVLNQLNDEMTDLLAGSMRLPPPKKEKVVKFAPGLMPVLKHPGHGNEKVHGRRGGTVSPQDISNAFTGTYTTDSGLEFSLVADKVEMQSGPEGRRIPVAGGRIMVGDREVGEWARGVDGDTMHAMVLTVGKTLGGNPIPGAEDVQGKGIALEIQKQTERAARDLGCSKIAVRADSDGTAAWAQERFGYRFEERPSLRANSKQGRVPKENEESIPVGGVGYVDGRREYRGADGLMYGFRHPDLGEPGVKAKLADIERRFASNDADNWPLPSEVISLGTGRRVNDDIIQNRTLGEFLLSNGWKGVKPADHVTKQSRPDVMRLTVEGNTKVKDQAVVKFAPGLRPVLKHGNHNQKDHAGRRGGGSDSRPDEAMDVQVTYKGLSAKGARNVTEAATEAGLSMREMEKHLESRLELAKDMRDPYRPEYTAHEGGLRWYDDAKNDATRIGGGDVSVGAGVISALSPQNPWSSNVRAAEMVMDMKTRKDELGLDTPDRAWKYYQDNHSAFGKGTKGGCGPVSKANFDMAWKIANGSPVSSTLTGRKRQNFFNNIVGDSKSVTVDVHMAKAMSKSPGSKISTKAAAESFLGKMQATTGGVGYTFMAQAVTNVANRTGLDPMQVQAIIWNTYVKEPWGGNE